MSTWLITGASGLLGKKLFSKVREEGKVLGWHYRTPYQETVCVDVRNKDAVDEFFAKNPVNVCIHCAAESNIKSCEDQPQRASTLNVEGTRNVATICSRHSVKLVHISTDYVFNGSKPEGYNEEDPASPLQVYGQTKLEAERVVRDDTRSLVLRMPILYGYNDASDKITWPAETVSKLKRGQLVVADATEIRQPTLIDDVADLAIELVRRNACGIFHLAPHMGITKFQWSQNIAKILGIKPSLVVEAKSCVNGPRRPIRSWLNTKRLDVLGLNPPRPVDVGTVAYLRMAGWLS